MRKRLKNVFYDYCMCVFALTGRLALYVDDCFTVFMSG